MKNLNKNQWIAVIVGIVLVGYLLFSQQIMNLFNTSSGDTGLEANNSGLVVQDVVVGTGDIAEAGDTLTVHYIGALTNGQVFDTSRNRNTPFRFTLGRGSVIRGWDEGLVGMRVGGRRSLVIPPDYAYGDQSVGTIPSNSTLLFEVELLEITPSSDVSS